MRDLTATEKKINSSIGKAIHDYSLISAGDRILVAVSGGKDSLTLLLLLDKIRGWAPVRFELVAAHVLSDAQPEDKENLDFLESLAAELGIELRVKRIKIPRGNIPGDKEFGCFWCAWNRRKALFELAAELSCGKVALGHHKDDIAETMLMNLLFKGEISVMNPRQELFGGKLTVIRPLCYVEEDMLRKYAGEKGFLARTCTCSMADTNRKFVKTFIKEAGKHARRTNIKTNIFRSVSRIREGYIDIRDGG